MSFWQLALGAKQGMEKFGFFPVEVRDVIEQKLLRTSAVGVRNPARRSAESWWTSAPIGLRLHELTKPP